MKKILTFFLFSIIFFFNINISFSIEPDIFIQSTVNKATNTLGGELSKMKELKN
jgi:phospholipid transport system substrate-binding protein